MNDAVVDGRYRILKNPNRWAVGNAYPAQDLERRESVVLVLPEIAPDQGPGFVQRARVEVERTRRLQTGHVITLRDCGLLTEGLPYFVIRRVQGNSLLRAVANGGPLSPDLALHVMERLLAHVGEAHAAGVVLGDIRPANIILADRKTQGQGQFVLPEPEVVDMAFARGLFDGLLPLPEAPAAYRSPESRAGLPHAAGDDVYALGAVLYFTLTGKAPRAQALDEQRAAPAPSTARPDLGLSAYLDKVVQTALAPRRADRYAGVKPFQDAIQGLRELLSLSDAARGVLQMAGGASSQVDGFESDPTQEFGRELVEALANRVLPAADQSEDVMTSVNSAAHRTADEAAQVLQAARDHENPFMFAPLRLDAEVRSVHAPPIEPAPAPARGTSDASFWRGVVFAGVFFALALGLGYLLFHQPEAPPVAAPPPASAEYLPSVSVPVAQPPRPAPASRAPVSAAAAPVPVPVSAAPVSAAAPETDEATQDAGPVVHLVLHLTPENARIYRVKTGELLCDGSPCSLTKPRMAPRGFLKVRMVAPGLPDKVDHIPVHQDATYHFDMRPEAAAEDKPSVDPASAAPPPPPATAAPELIQPF